MNASERTLQAAKEAAEKEMADVAALEVGLATFERKIADVLSHSNITRPILHVGNARATWNSSFCREENDKVYFLNPEGKVTSTRPNNFINIDAANVFGSIVDHAAVEAAIEDMVEGNISEEDAESRLKAIAAKIKNEFISHLRIYRQIDLVDFRVDMFATEAKFAVIGKTAFVTLPHKPFRTDFKADAEKLERYKAFFGEFDDFLQLLAASRFAVTRRNCFVWLQASSDWGKGFLIQCFKLLGLVFNLNSHEIEKAMKGDPVGIDPNEALWAWMMFHDELKSVHASFKELNDSISISPKNKPRAIAQLYLKLFFSAEFVRSLIDEGVEDQFDKRFNYLRPENHAKKFEDILDHPGENLEYTWAVANYIAHKLNAEVARYQAMGAVGANFAAVEVIKEYQKNHKLSDSFGSLDDRLPELVEDLRSKIISFGEWQAECASPRGNDKDEKPLPLPTMPLALQGFSRNFIDSLKMNVRPCEAKDSGGTYQKALLVKNADTLVDAYLASSVCQRLVGKVSYKSFQIIESLSATPRQKGGRVALRWKADDKATRERGLIIFLPF